MKKIWKRYSFGILFVCMTFLMGLYFIHNESNDDIMIVLPVYEGDTLWSISEQYADQFGMTTPELVELLKTENHLYHSMIKDGDELVIPGTYLKNSEINSNLAFKGK